MTPTPQSSHVSAVEYDSDTGTLYVEWNTGRVSAYSNVPPELGANLASAVSPGTVIRERIKPHYPHRYIK